MVIVKKLIYLVLGIVIVFGLGYWAGIVSGERDIRDLRDQLAEANRDFAEVRSAQLEAAERAERLQTELARVTSRAKLLQNRINRINNAASAVGSGIDAATGTATDSEDLLGENMEILRGIQENGRIGD